MKRIFSSVFIFMLIFTLSSCGSKEKKEDEKPEYKEQVKQEISVEKGGMLKTSDESVSIEVPGGALDSDTTITMTVYDVSNYPEANDKDAEVISAVVEFEPSGIVFKKPVFITMKSLKDVKDKVITAAVYRDSKGEWSYSEHGAAVKISGVDEAGDPIMTTAAGDPIMLSAAGDPIMMSAAGDPIMLSAAGDPIMVTAAGDPIMMSAAGDPIMMTTGHFTAYTFIAVNPKEPVEEPDDDDKDSDDDTSDVEISEDDDEISDEDENDIEMSEDDDEISDIETADEDADEPVNDEDGTPVVVDEDENPVVDEDTDTTPVPEPELLISKVLCTGQTHCTNGESIIECPKEGEDFYGQDAQYVVSKGCVPHKYTVGDAISDAETGETYYQIIDESTGLRWVIFYNNSGVNHEAAEGKCADLTAGGYEWRLPTVKEALSIADHDRYNPAANTFYFGYGGSFWTATPVADEEGKFWIYESSYGYVDPDGYGSAYYTACVSGEEYGKLGEIEVKTIGGDKVAFDSATNLMWTAPSSDNMPWAEALKYCENLTYAGKSDWRVPNKNELLTRIDYSAPNDLVPGYFWTSTFMPYYGSEGIFLVNLAYGYINYYTPYSDEYEYSVMCVRSDTKPLPEGKTIPYCNESRIAPCEDAATGRVWSSSDYSGIYRDELWWKYKAVQCRELNEGGISQWRIPTIDEIRQLLPLNDRLKPDGECKVTTECDDYYNAECFDSGVCSPGNEIIMSSLFDYAGVYISGTMSHQGVESEGLDYSWVVDLSTGSLKSYNLTYGDRSESRCIMDLSIPVLPEFPHTDSENHLIWSSLSKYNGYWYDAVRHCKTLNEGGSNNWRVPTIAELNTLVKSDPSSDPDQPNVTGRYSVFSDISTLWSSTYEGELKVFDFMNAYEAGVSDGFYEAKTRCVRSEDAPANVSEIQYPFENIDGLVWAPLSEETFYDLYFARDYCSGLNELNYGGYSEWRLPGPEELATLIKKSVCTNKSDFYSAEYSTSCDIRTFDGYSILGDVDFVVSEGEYEYIYIYDFARGNMVKSSYMDEDRKGRVRCVVRVEGQV